MAKLQYVRGAVSEEAMKILYEVLNGKKSVVDAAKELKDTPAEVEKAIILLRKQSDTSGYGANVQKMISFKGTVREMTLHAKNKKGGTYPLKVINLYMKPNTERYYEEKAYPVDKDAIRRGSESEGFYPNKSLWANLMPRRVRPKVEKPSTLLEGTGPGGEIILRKKGKSKGKLKLRKKIRKSMRKRKY